ncbi:Rib/alpha-like domain-containing protein, partial [Streptococcus mitis]|uniref:Rib/alpha-like domain-containing protein n=1 Tax=Streptococcus mitis TaxID=28037 RepID=UPI0021B81DF5
MASVVLQGKTIASTNINYRVLPTFPIAHTVYDFKGVNRSDDESKYYVNTGIPGGMKWFAKRGNEAEIDASGLRDKINSDPVGETTYKFGGKYNYGRFTDSPQPNEKLEHAATFTHKVFDIKPNDTKVTVAQGGTLSEAQAISAVAKVTGSPDLPSGTTYEWVDDRGNKITPTANTAGVQNFKVKVTLPPAQSGNDAPEATRRQPSKIITVPVNVTPPAPTVTTEPRYSGTLVSTDRSISGRGIAGATITVALQDGTTGTTLVNNQGEWTYNLKTTEKLTQNTKKDASIKADKEITVKQSKDGVESSATSVNVQLARVISINTPVQAGREITVKVPHDAGQFYVQLNYDTRQVYEYGVKQENGQWKITDPNKANTTELIVKNGDNVSEKELTLRIKDSNKKTNIPFTIPSGENKLRVRVHHVNGQNNPANPASEPGQGWVIASEATNESPTITVKEPTKTAYTADGSLTMAGLKKLVTVADKEDDADKTVGNRASDNFTLTVKQGANVVDLSNNKYLKKGTYTLSYTTRDAAGATAIKEHTITVSSLAESKGASITYPVDTAKVVYGNSDVENGNFKPTTKQTFANKLTEVNRGNNNLPTINGTGVTFTPGTTNDKEKVVVATFPDGSTLDISHAKVAKPAAPTITPSANFKGDLGSTERSISGTGIAGATVKIDLQGGKTVETTVGSDGNWTYNLKNNEVLTQNIKQDANTKSTKPVSVKQVMHGIESTDTTANVQLSDVITFDEPLQAGRDITLRVPHDAGRFYVIIASKEGNTFQYGVNKTDNGWQVEESVNNRPTGKTRTELTVSTTSNPAERVFKLHIKDSNQKTDIPFTMKADARSVMARVHYDNSKGNPAVNGGWTYTNPTNTNPTITVKAPEIRNYTADGSLTMDGLKQLVTAADTEDDANNTVGRTAKENLSVTIRQGNKVVNLANNGYLKKGEYTLTYTTTDAAGVSVTKEHTITVSSIPEVSIKAAKDATAQGIVPTTESNKVINSVTIPSNQPQPISKVLKDNGRITEVDGEKVATVVLTYSDNSTKEVTVPVLEVKPIDIVTTFNEKDNTVTIKPNTTVEINDRLQFGIRGKSMALTKTASGYTNSVNDRTITVNQDGSITITLVGEEKFQAGDRIVTRHESNKNGKVDSYETEAFAGLKPVEKVPAINLTALTNKEKEDVKAAVKKANPSVNTAELEVAANGDVTYRHKGAGVGASDPTPVITLSETVRERNDAEKIDPTIATLTRYVKETKHTDEQIKNAITGEHIANKAITGEIPTNGGTVVVKVTYTDGSSEDVKVPIIVTPELTPVKNLNDLTNKEKESVKAKIQTLNPTATNIVVKNNGETTLTIPDVTTAKLTPDKTVVEAQSNAIADPAKTPVVKLT